MIDIALAVIIAALGVLNAMRWLRVAQREHYLPWTVTRFAFRWRFVGVGLTLKGRTSKLAWTRRLKLLAAVAAVLYLVFIASWRLFFPWSVGAAIEALTVWLTIDIALWITTPIEKALLRPFVDSATKKLASVAPTIVGITGSYGKTSTKVVVAHLIAGTRTVAASPASFNNKAGLARAVNEGLPAGTDVFVAEMGTYGKGEIAELCKWCPPSIAAITAIGPVHLERFGSEDTIVEAKSEIFATAHTVVLNVDDSRLRAVADGIVGKKVVRVSAVDRQADVAVVDGEVCVRGVGVGLVGDLPTAATNAAVAIAIALELGVSPADAVQRLGTAPTAAHRLEATTAASGVVVLDDTFNSNPAGAQRAIEALATCGAPTGRRVLITPGMIELGNRQAEANEAFAASAGQVASVIGIVGKTNAAALARGAKTTPAKVERFATREDAVGWVRANLGPGDAVLYENDLPDHYA